jgi:hypothetical protein
MTINYKGKSDDELVQIIFVSAGQGGPKNAELESAKAELNKRLLSSLVNLNKSTTKYSKWLVRLTIVLALLVIAQIIIAICG